MLNFVETLLGGLLGGALYALIALGFVVIYKASRISNFAQGEFVTVGAYMVAWSRTWLGCGFLGSLLAGIGGMTALALIVNRIVLRHLIGSSLIGMIMLTIGLGTFLQGLAPLVFRGTRFAFDLPVPNAYLNVRGVLIYPPELLAAAVSLVSIVAVSLFFMKSRTGLALRAISDDRQVAMAMGIDLRRHFALAWALSGAVAVLGGTLWGHIHGFGVGLFVIGLKVFPIVMIGGLDSIVGAICGGLIVGVLDSFSAAYLDRLLGTGTSNFAPYVVMILMMMFRPFGLFGRPDVTRV